MSSPIIVSLQQGISLQNAGIDSMNAGRPQDSLSDAILRSSADALFSTNLQGIVTSWNPASERMFGYSAEQMIGSTTSMPFFPDRLREKGALIDRLKRGEPIGPFVTTQMHQDGTALSVKLTLFTIWNAALEAIGVGTIAHRNLTAQPDLDTESAFAETASLDDSLSLSERLAEANARLLLQIERVSAQSELLEMQKADLLRANLRLEQLNSCLEALATTDGLTGLKNHRMFQEKLQEEVRRSVRYGSPLSILMVDIDRFKIYNDAFGHPAGDAILRKVAEVLQTKARTTDVVARYGGEEFAIILPETDIEPARTAAERFRTAIESASWSVWPVTASIGVATLCQKTQDAVALIARADAALYRSKRIGRNCVTHAQDSMPLADSTPSHLQDGAKRRL